MVDGLLTVYRRLGRPPADIKSPTFWIMIDQIVQVWQKLHPEEVDALRHDVLLERSVEKSLRQLVYVGYKKTLVLPPRLFSLIKTLFPNLIVSDKAFTQNMISRYPFMNSSNYT